MGAGTTRQRGAAVRIPIRVLVQRDKVPCGCGCSYNKTTAVPTRLPVLVQCDDERRSASTGTSAGTTRQQGSIRLSVLVPRDDGGASTATGAGTTRQRERHGSAAAGTGAGTTRQRGRDAATDDGTTQMGCWYNASTGVPTRLRVLVHRDNGGANTATGAGTRDNGARCGSGCGTTRQRGVHAVAR
jgi:hypothetical protein